MFYPAIPLINDYTKGYFGITERSKLALVLEDVKSSRAAFVKKLDEATLEEVKNDADLFNFALAGGRSAFSVNCTQCHGSGAQGSFGYPNLNDDEWLWGGEIEQISYSITHGVRNTDDDDALISDMPAFLGDEILSVDEIKDVANHVLQISSQEHDQAAATRGAVLFEDNCAACHSEDGSGLSDVGAPALNNGIWLYGGDLDAVVATISNSRAGVMPAWGDKLDSATIKQLAIYVHSLGGGQ
jgi:cytochrome c oxidase cbb3-type subunit 3